MADTTFSSGTVITSDWLNDINRLGYQTFVSLTNFGATGDGVTNDTDAVQDFFDYLAANGGIGLVPKGDYLVTSAISLTAPANGFVVIGAGNESLFKFRATSNVTFFSVVGANDITMEKFKIDAGYSDTGFGSHGISFRNAQRCVWRDVFVYNYRNSAILTFVDADDTYGDCHMINCKSDGNGYAQNGFLHEGMLRSSIQHCSSKGFDQTGSPVYGLQLKNKSKYCWIDGGYVEGALGGIAFGGDGVTFGDGPYKCWVRGVITKDCLDGAVLGKSSDCTVEFYADQTNSPAPGVLTGYALNVAAFNVNLSCTVRIKGVQSGRTCINVRSDDVSIYVPYINGYGSKVLEMSSGVNRCRVVVQDIADTVTDVYSLITDNSAQVDNEFLFLRDLTNKLVLKDNATTAPATLTGKAQIYVDSADGDLKVKFSDGTVKTIVVDT
jgi:hypothetical protein